MLTPTRPVSHVVSLLALDRFRETPLNTEPFPHLIVPGFVRSSALDAIHADYPRLSQSGSFPLPGLKYGRRFAQLLHDLNGSATRRAFEEKFQISLARRPIMITVRGYCGPKDGRIHTDSANHILTVLLCMNPPWESSGGRLRLLRSGSNLEDMVEEIPPNEGTLLAFRHSNNSWHGHKPFSGPRRVIQFSWVTSEDVVRRELRRHRFFAFFRNLKSRFIGS
jgi:SM-20-related protein